MAKSRRNSRSRKASRKNRKASRRNRRQNGGAELNGAPVNYANPGPMGLSLAQGQQYGAAHSGQHGGAMAYGPYPGAVQEASVLPADLVASAHLLPLNQAFDYIRQFGPDADLKGGGNRNFAKELGINKGLQKNCQNTWEKYTSVVPTFTAKQLTNKRPECARYVTDSTPRGNSNNFEGGRRKGRKGNKTRKGSRKQRGGDPSCSQKLAKAQINAIKSGRKGSNLSFKNIPGCEYISLVGRPQHGGVLVRWGGSRRMRGGSAAEMRYPMPVADEGKMLIPTALQAQAGLNPEWKLAENPMSFAPIATKYA